MPRDPRESPDGWWDVLNHHWTRTGVLVAFSVGVVTVLLGGLSLAVTLGVFPSPPNNTPQANTLTPGAASTEPGAASTEPVSRPSPETSSPPSTTSTSTKSPFSVTPAVRHTGRFTVYPGYELEKAADLDAPQADPDWGRGGRELGDGVHEGPYLHDLGVGLYTPKDTAFALLAEPGGDDYSSCAQANLTTEPIPIGQLQTGSEICVRTSAGRLGFVKLLEEANPEKLVLQVTIWDGVRR